jgi:hypothetical protein
MGYATMVLMSRVVQKDPGKLGTWSGMAATALMDPKRDAYWRGMGLGPGATIPQRLGALQRAGIRTPEDLARAGFTEMRGRRGINVLLQQGGQAGLQAAYSQVAGMTADPGLLGRRRATAEAQPDVGPLLQQERLAETARAAVSAEDVIPTTAAARQVRAMGLAEQRRALARAMAMKRMGVVGVEVGEGAEGYSAMGAAWKRFWNMPNLPPEAVPEQYQTGRTGVSGYRYNLDQWYEDEFSKALRELESAATGLQQGAENMNRATVKHR